MNKEYRYSTRDTKVQKALSRAIEAFVNYDGQVPSPQERKLLHREHLKLMDISTARRANKIRKFKAKLTEM